MQQNDNNRSGDDRREKTERRQNDQDWTEDERRENDDRRSYVGRRQAAEWRRQH